MDSSYADNETKPFNKKLLRFIVVQSTYEYGRVCGGQRRRARFPEIFLIYCTFVIRALDWFYALTSV
jgi:hypothetical protein